MKPVWVRFKCFGPYVQEQFIDFRELEKNGLFLICGETGAGKTTILDAICYALYGRSSGGLRGDLSVMRCKLAENQEETLVEFVFDSDGQRYQFTRSLKYGRKNLNDSHNCLIWKEDRFVPIFENPKATVVNKKAEELIGLSYEQFRQVIILPQGQFEKLLVSNSEEKEKILVSLFHADRWQRIAEEIHRRVSERDKALNQEKIRIAAKLGEYGCETFSQLEEKRETALVKREEAKRASAETEKAAALAKTVWEQALLENREFEILDRLNRELTVLQGKEAFFAAEAAVLADTDRAETVRPQFAAYEEAAARKNRAENALAEAWKKQTATQEILEETLRRQQTHEAGRQENTEKRQYLLRLETARELYRTLAKKQTAAADAARLEDRQRKALQTAERKFAAADAAWKEAVGQQEAAIRAWQQAQQGYLLGIGGVLAERLEAGQPCPVCGSLEHPMPAKAAEGHISERLLDQRNREMNEANDSASAALGQRGGGEKAVQEARQAFHEAGQKAALARSEYETTLSGKFPGIDTETALEETIRSVSAGVNAYETEGKLLEKDLAEARGNAQAARSVCQDAETERTAREAEFGEQHDQWLTALARSGLETEDRFRKADMEPELRQTRTAELLRFRGDFSRAQQDLEAQKEKLLGKNAPDMESVRKTLDLAEAEAKAAASALTLAENRLQEMEADIRDLGKRLEEYAARRESVDGDLDFANRLRGRSGVSLQRYVLGVMLTSVTTEANRLLAGVYGGRYRLYRTDQIAGSARKGGLELEVYDSQNDQRRSVTTLSGGEKFLVALSLAIGLSTVVQAQGGGIRLEAMFIDEGFGSLDREAIGDALDVLQGIQKTAGTVGIISHVEALAESIPAKIEIVKGNRGSKCLIRG